MILTVSDLASFPTGVTITVDSAARVAYARHEGTGSLDTDYLSVPANTPTVILLTPGVYSFLAIDDIDPANVSRYAHLMVTTGFRAVATRVRAEVVRRFTLLGLPAMIAEQWSKTDESNLTLPCILLTVEDATDIREDSWSSDTQDWGRPIVVAILDNIDQYDQSALPDWESWRQSLIRSVNNQQLPIPESVICTVEPGLIADPLVPRFQMMVSGFLIRCKTREREGLGM